MNQRVLSAVHMTKNMGQETGPMEKPIPSPFSDFLVVSRRCLRHQNAFSANGKLRAKSYDPRPLTNEPVSAVGARSHHPSPIYMASEVRSPC